MCVCRVCVSECGTFGDHDKCVHDTFDVVIMLWLSDRPISSALCNVLTTCVSYIW